MRVFLSHLGCKLNQAEVEKLGRELVAAGHELVSSLAAADLHVVNSCTVTHRADRDSRKLARRAGRLAPGVKTVLTGCYATASPEEAAALSGVDLVVPNGEKDRLIDRLREAFPQWHDAQGAAGVPVSYVPLRYGNGRGAVKVEDGCNMRCAFCIIPFTRGRQRSRPLSEVVDEVAGLARGGLQEAVITGVQISSYRDAGDRLVELVRALLERTELPRFRLSSIAPWQFDPRLLDLWPEPRLCRHFHLSLQSGCDATLRRMRRPYTAARFGQLVARIHERLPGVALTSDVIVGFPGETDEEFEASLAFVESMQFARVHVFTYSRRRGTIAASLEPAVGAAGMKERMQRMRAVAASAETSFCRRQLGTVVPVVWEEERDEVWRGTSDNYLRVLSPRPRGDADSSAPLGRGEMAAPPPGIAPVLLQSLHEQGVAGLPV